MYNALSSCPAPAPAPAPATGTYQVLPPAFNTPAAMVFHQRVQAALAPGQRADTGGSADFGFTATVYDAAGAQLAYCAGPTALVLVEIEAQRASLAYLNHAGSL